MHGAKDSVGSLMQDMQSLDLNQQSAKKTIHNPNSYQLSKVS